MANILLVDSDPTAQKAMRGLLERGGHRFASVDNVDDAWAFIRENPNIDLLILELKLKGEGGLTLMQRLRRNPFLKNLPVIVYAQSRDRSSVVETLHLKAQNYLIKPYHDEAVYAEIDKATLRPWLRQHFKEEAEVCAAKRIEPEKLRALLKAFQNALEKLPEAIDAYLEKGGKNALLEALTKYVAHASAIGASSIAELLEEMRQFLNEDGAAEFEKRKQLLPFAASLLAFYLDPSKASEGFSQEVSLSDDADAARKALWENAVEEERCPVIGWDQLKRELDGLSGCPIISSVVASYQMAANGHPTSLSPLMELVRSDPGLTAQVLIASNQLKRGEDAATIEETRNAINLMGENRLSAIGGSLLPVDEQAFWLDQRANWSEFMIFQLGTASMAQFACNYLELPSLERVAYTASMIHDIGKLLLAYLHPYAYKAIHDHAVKYQMKLRKAEKTFMEANTREMAAHFAEKQGLPERFISVFRWLDTPEDAGNDAELVAIVSLARFFCKKHHVGFNGDPITDEGLPLQETTEWKALSGRLFLNFDLEKFEKQARIECDNVRRRLRREQAQ